MRGAAEVSAVLGECAEAEVALSVVEAIVVDVVDDEMVGGVGDLAVHFDAFAVLFSNGVVGLVGSFCKPGESGESRVVFGVDEGELTAG